MSISFPEHRSLKDFLDHRVEKYNKPDFIPNDPVAIPHEYSLLQDIEITGFWTAVLAWGQRPVILKKARELFSLMDNSPFQFITHHSENDLKKFLSFSHRTFNVTDTLYFIHFFKQYYSKSDSLESAFLEGYQTEKSIRSSLIQFHELFFSLPDSPSRTRKHISTPERNSACKRINMFLRWMVRKDDNGVDFGLWKTISPADLICPCDLHVDRVARKLGLITRKQTDWETAVQLTEALKNFDSSDPVKYDFALFSLGIEEKFA